MSFTQKGKHIKQERPQDYGHLSPSCINLEICLTTESAGKHQFPSWEEARKCRNPTRVCLFLRKRTINTILGGSNPRTACPGGSIVRNSHLSIGHDFAYASHLNGSLKQGVLMGRGGDLQVWLCLFWLPFKPSPKRATSGSVSPL